MPSSTTKRVVLYRFNRPPLEGYVNSGSYLLETGIEFITLEGNLQSSAYAEAKALCFVSGTGEDDLFRTDKVFERRPKIAGLWTRFWFRDGDRLDGVLAHNLLDWPAAGYLLTPPKASAARQRVFIPRAALAGTELRGVVGKAGTGGYLNQPNLIGEGIQLTIFDR